MAKDRSKSFSCSDVLTSFLCAFVFLLMTVSPLLTGHLFKPFSTSKNHFYDQILTIPNAITSHLCNDNSTYKDGTDIDIQKAASETVVASDHCTKKGAVNCDDDKVAFMFMTKRDMPLVPLWDRFFKGYSGKYSIYVHVSSESYQQPQKSSVFHGRSIPSKLVEWGKPSMVDAERRLLANALLDPLNQRFVLLSESCIPLFNFSTVYNYLMQSNLSFISSFDDPSRKGRGRYNRHMLPAISLADWRKGSQWFEAHRDLANVIVSDHRFYSLFVDYCSPPCYMDEHYIPTLITKLHPSLNSNRSLTWANWTLGGSHPAVLRHRDVSAQLIEGIRRAEHCMYNGSNTSVCFLFARKFDASSLKPLLQLSPVFLGY